MWKTTFHQWFTSGVSSIWTLPAIWVQRWTVSQVSLHAESGISGQGDDGFMVVPLATGLRLDRLAAHPAVGDGAPACRPQRGVDQFAAGLGLVHSAAVAGGSAMVSILERSSLPDAWSMSKPTTSPFASRSTTRPSTISRVCVPGPLFSSI